jgi:hypothetical protein
MNLLTKDFCIYKWRISFVALLWFSLAVIGVLLKIRLGNAKITNYLIFRNVFWHTIHQINLYSLYPAEKSGQYLYGPSFSIVIAPFSFWPINIGCFLLSMANAGLLFYAIRKLPVSYRDQNIILLISAIEMMTSIQNIQINSAVAGSIIFSFILVQKKRDFLAALFIATGVFVKLYGIVGITFLLFSDHKIKFILSFVFWSIILFCLPMLISSPSFIIHSYVDWYHTLIAKNKANGISVMQNISVMGMLLKIFSIRNLNWITLFFASLFYALPGLRARQLKNLRFRLGYLAFALIGVVIFSSSAESPTYIIAVSGVGIWYILQNQHDRTATFLLILTLLLTSLSSTDFFPPYIKLNLVQPYALKALPCFLVWLVLAFQLLKKDFNREILVPL